ncbi:hypothetical protein PISMIDRAFT_17959 [Pisolithus microcarpus 441]|uniref:Uncharacterized protein n=1 Tax=Pisolithus microcarpus 441 TaxID=765257 RepID=A0A0C9Z0H3_9AGAM|nr:hypothetical protein PISMIDRAFT_17959 [Pisolithus microcarpus 441]
MSPISISNVPGEFHEVARWRDGNDFVWILAWVPEGPRSMHKVASSMFPWCR